MQRLRFLLVVKATRPERQLGPSELLQYAADKLHITNYNLFKVAEGQDKINRQSEVILLVEVPYYLSKFVWEWFADGGHDAPYPVGTLMYFSEIK